MCPVRAGETFGNGPALRRRLHRKTSMPSLDEPALLALGTQPIDGPSPTGASVADDELYISVLAELGKMDRIEGDKPDWFKVEQGATTILRSKSKDFEIAAALGYALFKRYGYAGLSAAVALITEMVNTFWENSFPERPRRRKARIEALGDRFAEQGWFRENPPKGDDFDALDACLTRTEALKAALLAKMPDEPPELDKFVRGLKEHAGKRPKAAAPAAAAPVEGAATGGEGGAAGAGAAFSAGEIADPSAALNAVLKAALFLRQQNPADPLAYALVRVAKWTKIALPDTDAGKFQIPPPESSKIEALTHQFGQGLWEHLLKNAEGAFRSEDPLWLDLQRYVCAAMAGLGPNYEKARQAVMGQTGALVQRLGPGAFELKFRTGVPLCSGETRMWIEAEVMPSKGAAKGGGSGANGKLDEAAGKARLLVASGKLKEALAALQEGLAQCTQRRDRFLWRVRIAQLCYDAQKLQLAGPLLEECFAEIQKHRIDEWEPTLAVEVAQTLYRCRKALTAAEKAPLPETVRGVKESFGWLCQLDPLAALAAE